MLRPALLLFTLVSPALAQDPPAEAEVVVPDVTEIDFNAIDVHARLARPNVQLISEREGLKFPPMIRLRDDFTDQMRESVGEVR